LQLSHTLSLHRADRPGGHADGHGYTHTTDSHADCYGVRKAASIAHTYAARYDDTDTVAN
jgi:hypothetical protein